MSKEDFSIRLKKAMSIRNIKAADLAKKTNISPPMISDYLKGKYKAKQNNLYLLASALDVNEAWLMGQDVPINRIPDELRGLTKEETILNKIKNLSDEQQDAIINIIDNMNK